MAHMLYDIDDVETYLPGSGAEDGAIDGRPATTVTNRVNSAADELNDSSSSSSGPSIPTDDVHSAGSSESILPYRIEDRIIDEMKQVVSAATAQVTERMVRLEEKIDRSLRMNQSILDAVTAASTAQQQQATSVAAAVAKLAQERDALQEQLNAAQAKDAQAAASTVTTRSWIRALQARLLPSSSSATTSAARPVADTVLYQDAQLQDMYSPTFVEDFRNPVRKAVLKRMRLRFRDFI